MARLRLMVCVAALLAAPAARAQAVRGDIMSIGFEARGQSLNVIREGTWFPIFAKLNVGGTEHFQGRFVCERVDLDGDRVAYTDPQVAVTAGGMDRHLWLYASTIKENGSSNIDLVAYDQNNIAIPIASATRPGLVGGDTELILDISANQVDGLRSFETRGDVTTLSSSWGQRIYYRPVCVATLPCKSLPDRWIGLEAVNTIVWDEPDPDALTNEQIAALIQWVRAGGKLVIGIGPAWLKLQKSALRDILPLRGEQPPQMTAYLQSFLTRFVTNGRQADFKSPVSVVLAELAPDSVATVRDTLAEDATQVFNLVAMRWIGSGRVTAVAARLHDLAGATPKPDFYRELIDLSAVPDKFKDNEANKATGLLRAVELQPALVRPTEFSRVANIRMLVAFTFVGLYIGLATVASWYWLGRHKLTQLSWSVFAGFAVVASALGIVAVFFLRGATDRVASVSAVDLEAETMKNTGTQARAHVWFGYKSWIQQKIDLSLPGEHNFLRPMPSGPNLSSSYATPERYAAVSGSSLLKEAPMRATLKQFQGYWEGALEGGVRTDLTVDRFTGRIEPNSWVRSDLPGDIRVGYLLYIDPRLRAFDDLPPFRAAGLETTSFNGGQIANRNVAKDRGASAINVLCASVPGLGRGGQVKGLGRDEYLKLDDKLSRMTDNVERERQQIIELSLWARQNMDWVESLRPGLTSGKLDSTSAALMMASTRSLYLGNGAGGTVNFEDVGWAVTNDGLSELDVTHWLTRGQGILLLLSDAPGPAELHVQDRPLPAREGRTLYRVRVPINYVGVPPR
jgi:hypothetical protein